MHTTPENRTSVSHRLSILHLIVWSVGVAISLAVIRSIDYLIHVAYLHEIQLLNLKVNGPITYKYNISFADFAISFGYGTAVALAWFAIRGDNYWHVAGKIILSVIALMAVVDRGLTALAAGYLLLFDEIYIVGIYYGSLAPRVGYILGILVSTWIVIQTRTSWYWYFFWIALGLMSLLISVDFIFHFSVMLGAFSRYFFVLVTFPATLSSIIGLIGDFINKQLQWWTVVAVGLLVTMWTGLLVSYAF